MPLAAARVASGAGRAAIAAPKVSRIAKLATALLQHQLLRLPPGIIDRRRSKLNLLANCVLAIYLPRVLSKDDGWKIPDPCARVLYCFG